MPRFKFSPGGCGCSGVPPSCVGCPGMDAATTTELHVSWTNSKNAARSGTAVLVRDLVACKWNGQGPPDFGGLFLKFTLDMSNITGPNLLVEAESGGVGQASCGRFPTAVACDPVDMTFVVGPPDCGAMVLFGYGSFHLTQ